VISYVLPTRNRPETLDRTLTALGRLPHEPEAAEVVVVDNGSQPAVALPDRLANGVRVQTERLGANEGAAARNRAARAAAGEWLVMLDDDSAPLDTRYLEALAEMPPDVGAVGAEILLPDGTHEAGGLPEVFVGCGVAVRRELFCDLGGYDASMGYYAEEYDLCARLLLAGYRVVHDTRFRVLHEKTSGGRDMDLILRRLVRNNGWVMKRYAPVSELAARIRETVERYGAIAARVDAQAGYFAGLSELLDTLAEQPRRPMPERLFDRFTGIAHAREGLRSSEILCSLGRGSRPGLVGEGKNAWAVRQALVEMGFELAGVAGADVLVVGTISPGPILDALSAPPGGRPVVAAWRPGDPSCQVPVTSAAGAGRR
jgi:GT2 family glycosyltransferase